MVNMRKRLQQHKESAFDHFSSYDISLFYAAILLIIRGKLTHTSIQQARNHGGYTLSLIVHTNALAADSPFSALENSAMNRVLQTCVSACAFVGETLRPALEEAVSQHLSSACRRSPCSMIPVSSLCEIGASPGPACFTMQTLGFGNQVASEEYTD